MTPIPALFPDIERPETLLSQEHQQPHKLQNQRTQFCNRLLELNKAGLPTQITFALLRSQTASDFTYLARTVGVPAEKARDIDEKTRSTVIELLNLQELTPNASRRIFHPLKSGGLGLTSTSISNVPAHLASWLATAPTITESMQIPSTETLRQMVPAIDHRLRHASDLVNRTTRQSGFHHDTPAGESLSQKQLTTHIIEQDIKNLTNNPDTPHQELAAILSAGGPGAGAFLLPPTQPSHHMNNKQFNTAVRLRLHLPTLPTTCTHCKHKNANQSCTAQQDPQGTHAICCKLGGHVVRRHDSIRDALADIITNLTGLTPHKEVIIPHAAPNRENPRLDIVTTNENGSHTYIDVSIATATLPATIQHHNSHKSIPAAATLRANEKRRSYPGIPCTPFVLEAHGRADEAALHFIRTIAPKCPQTRSTTILSVWQTLSATLQRNNADAIHLAIQEHLTM